MIAQAGVEVGHRLAGEPHRSIVEQDRTPRRVGEGLDLLVGVEHLDERHGLGHIVEFRRALPHVPVGMEDAPGRVGGRAGLLGPNHPLIPDALMFHRAGVVRGEDHDLRLHAERQAHSGEASKGDGGRLVASGVQALRGSSVDRRG